MTLAHAGAGSRTTSALFMLRTVASWRSQVMICEYLLLMNTVPHKLGGMAALLVKKKSRHDA